MYWLWLLFCVFSVNPNFISKEKCNNLCIGIWRVYPTEQLLPCLLVLPLSTLHFPIRFISALSLMSIANLLRRGFSRDSRLFASGFCFFLNTGNFFYLSQNKTHLVSLMASLTITEEEKTKVNSMIWYYIDSPAYTSAQSKVNHRS